MKFLWSVALLGLTFLWLPSISVSQKVDKKLDPSAAKKAAKNINLIQYPKSLYVRADGIEESSGVAGKWTAPVGGGKLTLAYAYIETGDSNTHDTLSCKYEGSNSLSYWIRQRGKKGACQVNQDKASFSCKPD